ncbi:MAG: molybdenum cofactor biosynthesis protein MoaE [Candidatus Eisenbacteria bacterium]
MERVVVITRGPIETALDQTEVRADGRDGAWLDFYGIVRDAEPDGTPLRAIEYEAHEQMAEHQLHLILDRIANRHPVSRVVLVHRIGVVPVGEASLLVRVLSPHRQEALTACAEIIDELKQDVPIWKHPQ